MRKKPPTFDMSAKDAAKAIKKELGIPFYYQKVIKLVKKGEIKGYVDKGMTVQADKWRVDWDSVVKWINSH